MSENKNGICMADGVRRRAGGMVGGEVIGGVG